MSGNDAQVRNSGMNEATIRVLNYLIAREGEDDTVRFVLDLKKLTKVKVALIVKAIASGDVSAAKSLGNKEEAIELTPTSRVLWMLLSKAKLSKVVAKARLNDELQKLLGVEAPSPGRLALDKWVEQMMATRYASSVMQAAMRVSEL